MQMLVRLAARLATKYEIRYFISLVVALAIFNAGLHCQADGVWGKVEKKNESHIRLFLDTARNTYPIGSELEVTAYLENTTKDRFYYVGRDLGSLLSRVSLY